MNQWKKRLNIIKEKKKPESVLLYKRRLGYNMCIRQK